MPIQPNMEWYSKESQKAKVCCRCPFGSYSKCPRYFITAQLLQEMGSVPLDNRVSKKYTDQWKRSNLWDERAEDETSVSGGERKMLSNACPEVVFDQFGIFATYLYSYPSAEEQDEAIAALQIEEGSDDWRLQWYKITPQHYTTCRFFSLLSRQSEEPERIVDLKPTFSGMTLNLNPLIQRVWTWIKGLIR
ncbi:MAG: hypothetical protein Q7P63_01210 [Verrucomicrobiota bacterium JB022]|nr:hypothetical protein [Verrucomicrobiota bacterium JB022]